MKRVRSSLLRTVLVAVAFPLGSASAQLGFASAGAVDPANGFPENYVDTNGLSLDPCLTDPIFCGLDVPVAVPQPGQPFPGNYGGTFPDEFFFNRCVGRMTVNGGGVASVVIALEGAFLNGVPVDQDQMVFGRLRVRVTAGLVPGATYTVTTPVGILTFVADANGRINTTDDIGLIPLDFTGPRSALHSHVGPFLRWDSDLPLFDQAGNEYVGTPAIDHTITGSPAGTNFFRIDGPSVGGAGVNRVQTNLFAVTGLKSPLVPPPPLAPVANFGSAPNSGTAPLAVAFSDLSTGTITARTWSFGDGTSSTLTSPTHTYTAAGTYSVSLTVTGPGGTDTLAKPGLVVVTTAPPPPVGLTLANPVPGTAGVANTLVCTGARPNSVVGFFSSQTLGSSVLSNPRCPLGIPLGLGGSYRNMGTARANAAGVATFVTTPPASARGRLFHFQAVEPTSCSTSNVVHDVL